MKRVADEPDRESKRHKGDPSSLAILSDSMLQKDATELLNWTAGEPGFISGKVHMKWPNRISLETFSSSDGIKRFEVHFIGCCAEKLRGMGFQFKVAQELRLSLRGAEMHRKGQTNLFNVLPIVLKYSEGIALEIISTIREPGRAIDTWFEPTVEEPEPIQEPEPVKESDPPADDWFSTPKHTTTPVLAIAKGDLMDIDEEFCPVVPLHKPILKPSVAKQHPTSSSNPLSNIGNSVVVPRQPAPVPPTSSLTSSRAGRTTAHPSSAPKENPPNALDENPPGPSNFARPNAPTSHPSSSKITDRDTAAPASLDRPVARAPPNRAASPTKSEGTDTALTKKQKKNKMRKEKKKAKAALPLPGAAPSLLTAMINSEAPSASPPPRITHAAAVTATAVATPAAAPPPPHIDPDTKAESISAVTQQRHHIAVPSGYKLLSVLAAGGVPKWQLNSIIGVVASITGISLSQKGDWTCSMRLVDPSHCTELLPTERDGFRVNCFTNKYQEWLPIATVGDIIILRDVKVVERNEGYSGVVYANRLKWAVYKPSTGTFVHRDLPEGVPECDGLADGMGVKFTPFYRPTGADYSTCCLALNDWWRALEDERKLADGTVHQARAPIKPKRKHMLMCDTTTDMESEYFDCTVEVFHGQRNDNTFSLFVTDYTAVPSGRGYPANWCPPTLADHMLRIELWDAALEIGSTMLPGEFYWLKNVRMMLDRDGYPEAKLVETKIQKLDPDAYVTPELTALLERKKVHHVEEEIVTSDLKLIGQGQDKDFMNCVVELLHVEDRVIYITDYSSHTQISPLKETWARGLDGYVLKVYLEDEQPKMIQHLVVGNYYRILNLRLQSTVTTREFRGKLGGSDRLIQLLNNKSSALDDWKQGIIDRKNNLKPESRKLEVRSTPPPANLVQPVRVSPAKKHHNYYSIKQALSSSRCPGKFYVRARVVDFFPFRLEEAFRRSCTHCGELIPDKRLACSKCNDLEHKHVKIVCIMRIMIDDGENTLQLSVSTISLLDGFGDVILRDDPDAARRFSERMEPLINNLVKVHDGHLRGDEVELLAPTITLEIDSWKGENDSVIYGLRGYEL
ncbi:hypothetical protein C8R43DRAFT_1081769 [Mycena crocata]|nr:hypothetical protein C8R43DRAFT_1081769 [Mycena crocata]